MEIIEKLKELQLDISQTGSTVICDPAPTDTDIDFLVLVNGNDSLSEVADLLLEDGYELDENEHYQDIAQNTFCSFKKDKINLIVTKNKEFAKKHKLATQVSKELNLLEKPYRIMVFRAFLYGEMP